MNYRNIATLATAGLSLAVANVNAQEIEFDASVGFETEYVFRGIEYAGNSLQVSLQGNYQDAYFGAWTNEPTEREEIYGSEIDLYAGYGYAINDSLIADFGATVYYYPDVEGIDNDTFEIYTGLSLDSAARPSLYAFYDFDLDTLTLEGSVSQSYEIDERHAIAFGAAAGWVDEENGGEYWYYKVTADYIFTFSETMNATLGARAGGNDDHRGPGGKEANAWAGTSFNASF